MAMRAIPIDCDLRDTTLYAKKKKIEKKVACIGKKLCALSDWGVRLGSYWQQGSYTTPPYLLQSSCYYDDVKSSVSRRGGGRKWGGGQIYHHAIFATIYWTSLRVRWLYQIILTINLVPLIFSLITWILKHYFKTQKQTYRTHLFPSIRLLFEPVSFRAEN